jgi:hypothetical protein
MNLDCIKTVRLEEQTYGVQAAFIDHKDAAFIEKKVAASFFKKILEMSNSKNLLFLLLIATTQAIRIPIDMGNYCLTDCCVASYAYRTLGGKTVKDQALAKGCCSMLGKKSQSSGIPGVRCTADGNITVLDWANKNLTGRFPSYVDKKLGSLKRV